MRLIDADALKKDIERQIELCVQMGMGEFAKPLKDGLFKEVDKQPTVDAIPVEWMKKHWGMNLKIQYLIEDWQKEQRKEE